MAKSYRGHGAAETGREGRLSGSGAGLALWAGAGLGARLARLLGHSFGRLFALGHLALRQLLAFLNLGLRLLDTRRQRHGREDGLLGVVEIRDAVDRSEVGQAERVADRHPADVEVDVLRNLHRERFDVDLALHLREHAAFLRARGLADELDSHTRLDRLV